MTHCYSETEIRNLYIEFKAEKKYGGKLVLFDRAFGIIPFEFPPFDFGLSVFFRKETLEQLAEIFKRERNNPGLTEKKFVFDQTFTFSIKPANSNSAMYSSYILSGFLQGVPAFSELKQNTTDERPVVDLLDEANGLVNQIEIALLQEYDKSFRQQCMSVFFKGYTNEFFKRRHVPEKKRKFTELYLYALGVTYCNYVAWLQYRMTVLNAHPVFHSNGNDLRDGLLLMQELGITEFLRSKYASLSEKEFENKITEILGKLTSQDPDTADRKIDQQDLKINSDRL